MLANSKRMPFTWIVHPNESACWCYDMVWNDGLKTKFLSLVSLCLFWSYPLAFVTFTYIENWTLVIRVQKGQPQPTTNNWQWYSSLSNMKMEVNVCGHYVRSYSKWQTKIQRKIREATPKPTSQNRLTGKSSTFNEISMKTSDCVCM